MTLFETAETNRFTFEPFANHKFYTDVNRILVQNAVQHMTAHWQNSNQEGSTKLTIVDMACGTGAISLLVAEEIAQRGLLAKTHIIGVDPSTEALRLAHRAMQEAYPGVRADFLHGDVADLSSITQRVDGAFFCNAIHLVPDKLDAFRHVASMLVPGGIFACNSAFYHGTYVEGTERFYRQWTRRAIGWLRKEHPEVHLSRENKAMAMQWLTADEYINLLHESGFGEINASASVASLSLDAWRDIGQYWLFIEGALPGVPLALGAAALKHAVYQAGQELDLTEIPRVWLQLIATKDS